jgi:hypothetical protein
MFAPFRTKSATMLGCDGETLKQELEAMRRDLTGRLFFRLAMGEIGFSIRRFPGTPRELSNKCVDALVHGL